jgi:hypothetical protein
MLPGYFWRWWICKKQTCHGVWSTFTNQVHWKFISYAKS